MNLQGGVGKSTVTATMARCFATKEDLTVGVLDIDLCGPSMPRWPSLQTQLGSQFLQDDGL